MQGIVLTENQKTIVLLTHSSDRLRTFIDSISLQIPLPTVDVIFQQWDARDEKEHTEANIVDFRSQS